MHARAALLLVVAVSWDAWRLLAGRIHDAAGAMLVLALVGAVGWLACRGDRAARMPGPLIADLLLLCAAATILGPALLQIGAAIAATALAAWHCGGRGLPRMPLIGLALLALPVLPTLDFLLAYPLRRVSAMLTVGLLRLNGMSVGLEGVALQWHGRRLLFDAPCSGVRMLWAGLVLASLIGLAGRFGPGRYALMLGAATAIAIVGNALRAASLFYLENGFVAPLEGPVAHEALGIVSFCLLAAAIAAAARPLREATA